METSNVFENLSILSIEEKEKLELLFFELEISNALMACTPKKAPDPYNYHGFFQKMWCFIKEGMLATLNFFH